VVAADTERDQDSETPWSSTCNFYALNNFSCWTFPTLQQ